MMWCIAFPKKVEVKHTICFEWPKVIGISRDPSWCGTSLIAQRVLIRLCYAWSKNRKNQRPLDILDYNSVNEPSFQNPTNFLFLHFLHLWTVGQKGVCPLVKRWSIRWITGQNVQKLLILAVFASCIASIVKWHWTFELSCCNSVSLLIVPFHVYTVYLLSFIRNINRWFTFYF